MNPLEGADFVPPINSQRSALSNDDVRCPCLQGYRQGVAKSADRDGTPIR